MSLPENSPLSIVDLNADCLFEIFDRLPIGDVLNFRLQCRTLNDAVCKYLRQTTKLSIVYTEHGPEGIPSKNLRNDEKDWEAGDTYFESDWLSRDVTDFTRKFAWRNKLIVIFGREKFQSFLKFIAKHKIENIKKLSLIIDTDPIGIVTLSPATELLKLCPKVETLFLERATRGKIMETIHDVWTACRSVFKAEDLGDLFDTITGLASLSELHFFTWSNSLYRIFLTPSDAMEPSNIPNDQINQMFGAFLLAMFQKLPIFGFNHQSQTLCEQAYLTPLLKQNFENIQELGFEDTDFMQLVISGMQFPNLRSLTLFSYGYFERINIGNSFEKLTTLRFVEDLELTKQAMLNLNSLTSLETLSARSLMADQRNSVDGHFPRNSRINHIEVEKSERRSPDEDDYPLCSYTDFFLAIETVTVSPPDGDSIVYDINTLNDLRIAELQ